MQVSKHFITIVSATTVSVTIVGVTIVNVTIFIVTIFSVAILMMNNVMPDETLYRFISYNRLHHILLIFVITATDVQYMKKENYFPLRNAFKQFFFPWMRVMYN